MACRRTAWVWCAALVALFVLPGAWAADAPVLQFVDALNRERSAAGAPPLRLNDRLVQDARSTAAELARNGGLEIDIDAQERRLRQARYPLRKLGTVTGLGNATVARVLDRYLADAGSRDLLLSLHYSDVGVGVTPRPANGDRVWVVTLAEPYVPASRDWHGQIIAGVNAFRAEHGLPPLTRDARLDRIAQAHSEDMALRDFFAHQSPDGANIGDRARRAGYRYRTIGENLAAGMRRPAEVVEGWIGSPPHRDAMLGPDYREAGVGYAYDPFDDGTVRSVHYWTLTLGRR